MDPALTDVLAAAEALSAADRLQLIGKLWDGLSQPEQLEIPESHREELDRRLASANANPEAGCSWEEVKSRLRSGK